jgi:hypothetical protein
MRGPGIIPLDLMLTSRIEGKITFRKDFGKRRNSGTISHVGECNLGRVVEVCLRLREQKETIPLCLFLPHKE